MATDVLALVECVESMPGIKPALLAERLSVSTRTLRTYVRRANASLDSAAQIVLRRGRGYGLDVADIAAFAAWKAAQGSDGVRSLPTSPRERTAYLVNDLLSRTDWVTLDALAEVLCVSRATISQALRQAEELVGRYGLTVEKRPHYGIRVSGSEMGRRVCLASLVVSETEATDSLMGTVSEGRSGTPAERAAADIAAAGDPELGQRLLAIIACVDEVLRCERFQISSVAHRNLIVHIAIATRRIETSHYVPMEPSALQSIKSSREYAVAEEIAREISHILGQDLPEAEVAYIAIHLASKGFLPADENDRVAEEGADGEALVIPDDVWGVVARMLERVWRSFRFDLRDDLELRMNLACHIVPLAVRLRYHMNLQNPILCDIRVHFPLAYSMALDASTELARAYGSKLSEDEVGYIAMAFALALERKKSDPPRKGVLIVCASGVGSARLLEHRVRSEFGSYIDYIVTCDVNDVSHQDFSKIDYVFTTVPISEQLPVPVCEVRNFIDADDVRAMHRVLSEKAAPDALRFFDRRLFIESLEASSKVEAIDAMCDLVMAKVDVSPDFRDQVWAREGMVPTCFGNGVAVPHPLEPSGSRTVVAVGVLAEPIAWDDYEVEVVFMTIISKDDAHDMNGFYKAVADLLTSREAMQELVRARSFDTLAALVAEFSGGSVA